jgi:hypothetical protein
MATPINHAKHRARDELELGWVTARAGGQTPAAIAAPQGRAGSLVSLTTKQIKDADIAHGGDPEGVILAAYWRRK